MPPNRMIWHINVSNEDGKLYGLLTLSTGLGGKDARLYYADWQEDIEKWIIRYEINTMLNMKYIKKVYRSSLIKLDDEWYIYISICTNNDCWYIFRKRFYLNDKN